MRVRGKGNGNVTDEVRRKPARETVRSSRALRRDPKKLVRQDTGNGNVKEKRIGEGKLWKAEKS